MDEEYKKKYEKYKLTVKIWENDFKKKNNRIPSKLDIRDAPINVKQSYKMYYKMKTAFLSQSMTDILQDDDEEQNSAEFIELSESSMNITNVSISDSICELLDPTKKFPSKEFDAVDTIASNENAWNSSLNKPKPVKPARKLPEDKMKNPEKKIVLNMSSAVVKAPRNPRKALAKTKSSQQFPSNNNLEANDLPDLETILLEKSRAARVPDVKLELPQKTEIKNTVDNNWLNRNSDQQVTSTVSSMSSFGLSNLNLGSAALSLNSEKIMEKTVEVKYHSCDVSDNEYEQNEESKREMLPISKKRKISNEENVSEIPIKTSKPSLSPQIVNSPSHVSPKNIERKITHYNTDDDDDSDKDSHYKNEETKSPSPVPMKRKRSIIKRSKDGIGKVTKKASKLLTRGRKKVKEPEEPEVEKEEEINYFIDTEFDHVKTVPRVSDKFLNQSEKLLEDFIQQKEPNGRSTSKISDYKTAAKKDALQKKIASGTLNDNYVRVNLKKKVFVRGKKAFNFSRYKKTIWKSKKQATSLNDMRGCDGGVQKCFSCGGIGHFAQQCKQKGDNLMPIDADVEEESALPTLEQAAMMAEEQKLLVHANKQNSIPSASNEIWKEGEDSNETNVNKENQNLIANRAEEVVQSTAVSVAKKSYVGHQIPDDFLKKSGILELSVGNKDEVKPYYSSLPKQTPKEVLNALKLFGHKSFRRGQEQAVLRVLSGMSTLVTLSTGSGKSLCYQLPAYLYSKKSHCITLVISPLVSLMEDQVHGIPDFVNAQCLHTNQTPKQKEKVMEEIKLGRVNVLLISPEAVVSGETSSGFGSLLRQLPPIAFACIDEAHCVSQWSHNFRPSYLMICRVLREKLGVKTVLGLTATATLQTRNSIVRHLDIADGLDGIISDTPLPDNLILTISKDENRDRALIGLLRSERFENLQSIIIYCTRREECERIAGFLRTCLQDAQKSSIEAQDKKENVKKRKRNNWLAEAYHAGLPASRRRTIQNAFMSGDLKIVVATIAFGMGINKSDIRGIIHYNMPRSFESFVQEVGRAGRDGNLAQCHVFLDSRGEDLSELRRHIYANSIDRHVIRKLLQKVFIPCSCKQREGENIDDKMEVDGERVCKGHEVCFSIEQTIQLLDIPQENIATLLCYLELHEKRYIKVLGNAYTNCKILSYSGPSHMKQMAKTCPPLAMAIAMELKNGKKPEDLGSLEFCVIDVASAIGWDSGVVKYQLKQLEWTTSSSGGKKRSPLTVTFSDLGFRIKSPGDLSDDELDHALDTLANRTSSQELTQLIQLQIICDTFNSLATPNFIHCATSEKLPIDKSNELKTIIRNYFQTNLPMNVEITDGPDDTSDSEIITDIKMMMSMYPENNFSGRALARIFHGISSPCYPAVIWGRCKYWRAHLTVSFHRLVKIANREIVKSRVA